MKNQILFAIMMAFAFASCESTSEKKSEETKEAPIEKSVSADTTRNADVPLFACSMHPEIIGKKDEKCSKCGMDLTEPIKE